MSEEERKFLEIVDLKKGFGSGETRQEVLRGMNFSVAKGERGRHNRQPCFKHRHCVYALAQNRSFKRTCHENFKRSREQNIKA